MPLSESQLQGLKKNSTPIVGSDLQRVLPALGLRASPTSEPGSKRYEMPIIDHWVAVVNAVERTVDGRPAWRLDFFVFDKEASRRVGPVTRIEDANVLQLRGARVMADMFESVDELAPFTCGECEAVALTWDGQTPSRNKTKAGMVCGGCGWKGHTGEFLPFRQLR